MAISIFTLSTVQPFYARNNPPDQWTDPVWSKKIYADSRKNNSVAIAVNADYRPN